MSQNQAQRPVLQSQNEGNSKSELVSPPVTSLDNLTQNSIDSSESFRDFRYKPLRVGETIVIGSEIYDVKEILGRNEGQTFVGIDTKGKKKKVKLVEICDDMITTKENGVEKKILLVTEKRKRMRRLEDRLRKTSTALNRNIEFADISENIRLDLAIVNDYIEGQNLRQSLDNNSKNFTPSNAKQLLTQLLTELSVINSTGVLHGDITPSNIIVDLNGDYHLTDYGLSTVDITDGNLTITGDIRRTPNYVKEIKPASKMTSADDLYGLARTVIFALSGKETEYQVASEVEKYDKTRVENLAIEPQLKLLLLKMMGYIPKKTVLQKVKDALIVNESPDTYQTAEQVLRDLKKLNGNESKIVTVPARAQTINDVVDSQLDSTIQDYKNRIEKADKKVKFYGGFKYSRAHDNLILGATILTSLAPTVYAFYLSALNDPTTKDLRNILRVVGIPFVFVAMYLGNSMTIKLDRYVNNKFNDSVGERQRLKAELDALQNKGQILSEYLDDSTLPTKDGLNSTGKHWYIFADGTKPKDEIVRELIGNELETPIVKPKSGSNVYSTHLIGSKSAKSTREKIDEPTNEKTFLGRNKRDVYNEIILNKYSEKIDRNNYIDDDQKELNNFILYPKKY